MVVGRHVVGLLLWWMMPGCGGSTEPAGTGDTAATPVPLRPVGLDPSDDLAGLAELTCAQLTTCPDSGGPYLGDTCCTFGDPLVEVFTDLRVGEGVAVDAADGFVLMCTGTGAAIAEVSESGALDPITPLPGVSRCQHAVLSPAASDGSRAIFATHQGDTSFEPALWHVHRAADGTLTRLDALREPDVRYAGLDWVGNTLWVGSFSGGLRIYALGDDAAREPLSHAAQELRELDSKQRLAVVLLRWAALELKRDQHAAAGPLALEALELSKVLERTTEQGLAHWVLSRVAAAAGDDAAAQHHTEALQQLAPRAAAEVRSFAAQLGGM